MSKALPAIAALVFLMFGYSGPKAQNIDMEAMELADQLLDLSGSRTAFDPILPNVAESAKQTLIRSNPQMQLGIIDIVDRVAVNMVENRADLDRVLAEIWASAFTKEQMKDLIAFYSTDAGQAFRNRYPTVAAAQFNAAEKWSDEISELMLGQIAAEIRKTMPTTPNSLEAGAALPEAKPQ